MIGLGWIACLMAMASLIDGSGAAIPVSHLDDWTTMPKFIITKEKDIDPLISQQNRIPSRSFPMTGSSGENYICSLPTEEGIRTSINDTLGEYDSSIPVDIKRNNAVETFKKSIGDQCFKRNEGFWTFEICPFKSARQLRMEGSREMLSFSLGEFRRDFWNDEGNYVQEYGGGSDRRLCTAIYSCRESLASGILVFRATTEPVPYQYMMDLQISSVCLVKPAQRLSPSFMLSTLATECIPLDKGWWSYEFCYLKNIRQYHSERVQLDGDPAVPGAARFKTMIKDSFILGNWAGANNDSAEINLRTTLVSVPEFPSQSYISQKYTDGTPCDLTGTKRETEVRFMCNKHFEGARFVSVKETKTCSYVVVVETSLICSHPSFTVVEPVVYEIKCLRAAPAADDKDPPSPKDELSIVPRKYSDVAATQQGQELDQSNLPIKDDKITDGLTSAALLEKKPPVDDGAFDSTGADDKQSKEPASVSEQMITATQMDSATGTKFEVGLEAAVAIANPSGEVNDVVEKKSQNVDKKSDEKPSEQLGTENQEELKIEL